MERERGLIEEGLRPKMILSDMLITQLFVMVQFPNCSISCGAKSYGPSSIFYLLLHHWIFHVLKRTFPPSQESHDGVKCNPTGDLETCAFPLETRFMFIMIVIFDVREICGLNYSTFQKFRNKLFGSISVSPSEIDH